MRDGRERLLELALTGDSDASRELLELATHRNDPSLALVAVVGLRDPIHARTLCGPLSESSARLADALSQVGYALPSGARFFEDEVEPLVARGNGRARNRKIGVEHVVDAMLQAAASAHGFGWTHGGVGASGKTSYAMAVVVGTKNARMVVATGRGSAKAPSPGKGFRDLGTWSRNVERNLDKARAWAKSRNVDDVVTIPYAMRAQTRATKSAADRIGIPGLPEKLAAVLAAPASAASFVTLVRAIRDSDPGEDIVERLDTWLDRHWPVEARRIQRSFIKQMMKAPERRAWRLIRGIEFSASKTVLPKPELEFLGSSLLCHDQIQELVFKRSLVANVADVLDAAESWTALRSIAIELRMFGPTSEVIAQTAAWRRAQAVWLKGMEGEVCRLLRQASANRVTLHGCVVDDKVVESLRSAAPATIVISNATIVVPALITLVSDPSADHLETLIIERSAAPHGKRRRGDDFLTRLSQAKGSALRRLDMVDTERLVTDEGAVAIVSTDSPLRSLDLRRSGLSGAGLAGIGQREPISRFESLGLTPGSGEQELLVELAESPYLRVAPDSVVKQRERAPIKS